MTDWLRIIDRGIDSRVADGEPPLFEPEAMADRLATSLDENEIDPDKLKLMNLCFDALVCIREAARRAAAA